ncbi:MAG: crosslink repair DNA glycosylase YcaQ family protein [Micropruina sp.]|uniref:DNA glycosylase AlkZ-like family protein n=1 Tax=Micropruina sp. TaxID=2737536 RepID=UPI0039E4CC8E
MQLDGRRALAWRLRRHGLDPASGTDATDVAERVLAVRGWPDRTADLAFGVRLAEPVPDVVPRAVEVGELIRSYAFRGGSYVFAPEIGAVLLAVRTVTAIWRTDRWQRQGDIVVDDWEPVRDAIRTALADGPLTRDEIAEHLRRSPTLRRLADAAATGAGADTLYKPLHWWGDICFGPARGRQATFRLLRGDPHWPGLPDVEDAGRRAIVHYLHAYGPATEANLQYWLSEGLGVPTRRLAGWLAELADVVTAVSMDGLPCLALTADLDEMAATEPSDAVVLLPGYDPWMLGPGTADPLIVTPARRALITNGGNAIIRDGQVCGTWRPHAHTVMVSWFAEAGPAPSHRLADGVRRLGAVVWNELQLDIAPH